MARVLTITFDVPPTTPPGGYNVQYRILGSTGVYTDAGTFPSSPAVIGGLPDGNEFYEGFIRSICDDGLFSEEVPFTIGCTPVDFSSINLSAAYVGINYAGTIILSGTPPYFIDHSSLPDWMEVNLVGDTATFSGKPHISANNEPLSITFSNCDGETKIHSQTVTTISSGTDIVGYKTFVSEDICKTVYKLSVIAMTGDSLTITATMLNGNYLSYAPTTPVTITYSAQVDYIQELANAAGQGYSALEFRVMNNTTGIETYVDITRLNDLAACL